MWYVDLWTKKDGRVSDGERFSNGATAGRFVVAIHKRFADIIIRVMPPTVASLDELGAFDAELREHGLGVQPI